MTHLIRLIVSYVTADQGIYFYFNVQSLIGNLKAAIFFFRFIRQKLSLTHFLNFVTNNSTLCVLPYRFNQDTWCEVNFYKTKKKKHSSFHVFVCRILKIHTDIHVYILILVFLVTCITMSCFLHISSSILPVFCEKCQNT